MPPSSPPRPDPRMPHPSTAAAAAPPLGCGGAAADPCPARYSSPRAPIEAVESTLGLHPRGDHASPATPADPRQANHEGSKETLPSGVILDSGAAGNATGTADWLSDLRAPPGGETFRTRVGTDLPVAAVGTLTTPRFAVPDIRHVPGLGHGRTLVSVRQLARRGLTVSFGAESCSIKDPSTGAVVGEGRLREDDGFYHLQYLRVPQS
ncbi:hypothetical protein BAE44_0006496 [Dichanthelium oligosanthes]|uniref:Uncharacterized protein n=1 Tax=Dichanthelium oligosanthes TaxID=888268 RepID=A0A1E5W5F4_9POAL|nr:hypothetical protein BAE44_0006496 [Dichanthelium oligosanthes]